MGVWGWAAETKQEEIVNFVQGEHNVDRQTFITRLEQIKNSVLALGAKICSWEIDEPSSMETVCKIEKIYRIKLPSDFVKMVTEVAGRVNIAWSIYENKSFREQYPQFQNIISGALQWDIEHYLKGKEYQSYQYYTTHWEDMRGFLDFAEIPNGDMLLFNLVYPGDKKPVVYLNHDGEYAYPVRLAESFQEYVERLLKIGLVGSEIWQLEKFIRPELEEKDGKPCEPGTIDPECAYALKWKEILDLSSTANGNGI